MAQGSVLTDLSDVLRSIGATDALVYRRAVGGRFVLTVPGPLDVADELMLDDEPLVVSALATGLRRVAAEAPRPVCAGYVARAAAIVAVDRDVVVVLGRRDGCLAGVSDEQLVAVATTAASNPASVEVA